MCSKGRGNEKVSEGAEGSKTGSEGKAGQGGRRRVSAETKNSHEVEEGIPHIITFILVFALLVISVITVLIILLIFRISILSSALLPSSRTIPRLSLPLRCKARPVRWAEEEGLAAGCVVEPSSAVAAETEGGAVRVSMRGRSRGGMMLLDHFVRCGDAL